MHKAWIIGRQHLQMTLQNRQYWLLLLGLPALVIYLVGLGTQGIARAYPTHFLIDVLNQDSSAASRSLVARLAEANETLLVCPRTNDSSDSCQLAGASLDAELAQERLAAEVTFATITIPDGFGSGLAAGEEVNVWFEPAAALAAPGIAFLALTNAVTEIGGPIVAARLSTEAAESMGVETGPGFYAACQADVAEAWGPPLPVEVAVEVTHTNQGQILGAQLLENGFKLSTPSMTAMFVMISILGMTQSLAEERMLGVLRRMGMMPVSRAQFLGGKLIATYAMGLVQFVVLLTIGRWLGVEFGGALAATLLVGVAYVLAVTALALALATLARTPGQASAIATFACATLVPLGGGWWPLVLVPTWLRHVGHVSPVAWCLDALNELVFYGGTMADILPPVGVLLLFAVGLFTFGILNLDYQPTGDSDGTRILPLIGIHSDG